MADIFLKQVGVVILAAGKGSRLNCVDHPKAMHSVGDKPIVSYIIEKLEQAGVPQRNIYVVVGFCKEKIMEYFKDRVNYVEQAELLGTAHAAYLGSRALPQDLKYVLVLNGDDSAFYHVETLEKMVKIHTENGAVITLLSVESENPTGKIVHHPDGRVEIVEKEYVTEEQKKIKETSTGTFCFDRKWFEKIFPVMPRMKKLGKVGEYGMPTTFAMAAQENLPVRVMKLDSSTEWFGVNTPEELAEANRRKKLGL
ncbi:MAG TPA: NTP transferase domain-containing protein [Candidatus Magasanikbacteria bacterium]|mgnify:CR=1 FL=1|nr:NTP transferase domain-containing protein [Candidatus Magasanikbacteria bacterium]